MPASLAEGSREGTRGVYPFYSLCCRSTILHVHAVTAAALSVGETCPARLTRTCARVCVPDRRGCRTYEPMPKIARIHRTCGRGQSWPTSGSLLRAPRGSLPGQPAPTPPQSSQEHRTSTSVSGLCFKAKIHLEGRLDA